MVLVDNDLSNRLKNGKYKDGDNDVLRGNVFPSTLYQERLFCS